MRTAVAVPAWMLLLLLVQAFSLRASTFYNSPAIRPGIASGGNFSRQPQRRHGLNSIAVVGNRERSLGGRLRRRVDALAAVNEQEGNVKTGTAGWAQRTVTVTAPSRGCHLITSEIMKQMPELRSFRVGMANIFLKHTSASLTINENADPDVRTDMESALNQIVPVKWHNTMFRHTLEGPDDMTGHVKSTIVGASLNIPVSNGCLALGTWQGVYLCEHRDTGGWGGGFARDIVVTIQGITAD